MQPPSAMSSNGGPARPSAASQASRGAQHAGRYPAAGFQQHQAAGLTADGLIHERASFELTEEDVDAIRLRFQSGTNPSARPKFYLWNVPA